MAQTVHLKLRIDGTDIEGESTVQSLDRADTIECDGFYFTTPITRHHQDVAQEIHPEREHMHRISIKKRIDKSSPRVIEAKFNNQLVNRAEFLFFRPSGRGEGDEELFYTISGTDGYVISIETVSDTAVLKGERAPPMIEEIEFAFRTMKWEYHVPHVEFQDDWRYE
jgi:type VI secretion system Hcp family effector